MTEQDLRLSILNTLLTTPHKQMSEINKIHQQMVKDDPLFYQQLAVWYFNTGAIRDHKEAFVTNLCLSNFDGHRDVGLALLREMPTYQIANIVNFIHCKELKKNKSTKVGNKWNVTTITDKGLGRNIPRSMVTEITNYLREREADPEWFESNVLVARKDLKRLYALLHIKPSDLAQQILFDDKPPEGSKLKALKDLSACSTPAEQAKVILENKIPYRIATTVVHQMTPTVMYALLEVMSSQELINSIGMLKQRGVFDNPELSELVKKKLDQAKKNKNVAGLKALEAIKASGVTGEVADKLAEVADAQVKSRGKISMPTAILIDKSGSMSTAIEIGKAVSATVANICTNDLFVYCVDTMPYKIKTRENTIDGWNKAFKGIKEGGGTIISSALSCMIKNNEIVEQILIITDENEQSPQFAPVYEEYCKKFNIQPKIIFIKCGHYSDLMEKRLLAKGADVSSFIIGNQTDYYSLPGVIDLLSRGSRLDLLIEIMSIELPNRKKSTILQTV